MAIKQLKPDSLYQRCDPEQFDFRTTAELEDLTEIIGQPRAVDAVRFGIGIRHKGYNLFALGPTGTGKHALVQRYAIEHAETGPVPPDWCYVNNFQQPHEPRILRMPPGRGVELERGMEQLVEDLYDVIPTVFESDEYHTRTEAIEEELSEKKEQALQNIKSDAENKKIGLIRTPTGFTLAPMHNDEALNPEEFEKLPKGERKRIEQDTEKLQEQLRKRFQSGKRKSAIASANSTVKWRPVQSRISSTHCEKYIRSCQKSLNILMK